MKKKIYSFLLFVFIGISAVAQNAVWDMANEAYSREEYDKAIELYRKAGETSGVSSTYYYNLGNAYYKNGEIANAILNYERALILNPKNEDVRFNLALANMKVVDRIEPTGRFFLSVWIESIQNLCSSNVWAIVGIALFFVFAIGVSVYFFMQNITIRKFGFFGAIVFLLLSLSAIYFSAQQEKNMTVRDKAIIFAPTVSAKSSPSESGTDLFILHEGTKVSVVDKVSTWTEVRLADGTRGWIPTKSMEVI